MNKVNVTDIINKALALIDAEKHSEDYESANKTLGMLLDFSLSLRNINKNKKESEEKK